MAQALTRDDVLVSTDWLAEHLDDPNVRIIDCRYSFAHDAHEDYLASHIPGAVYLNWATELCNRDHPVEHMMATVEQVEGAMRRVGVSRDTLIVAYDQEGGHYAARIWLVLARYGRSEQLRILDGGWTKWQAEGRPTSTDIPNVEPGDFTIDPAEERPEIIASLDDVREAVGSSQAVLLDVRRESEFTGEEVRAKHGGRIPGATHRFWQNNLNWADDRTFREPDEIRAFQEEAGVTPETPVITYCQGAVRAAHVAIALWMAGYRDVRVYDGSWAEWGNRDDVPIEIGLPNESTTAS